MAADPLPNNSRPHAPGAFSERLPDLVVAIKGGGDLATGIAATLFRAGLKQIYILETAAPTVIRRKAAFAAAIYEQAIAVEGIRACRVPGPEGIAPAWSNKRIPVLADPRWLALSACPPQVLVDAAIAKKNLGTRISDAPLVIGLGPGFTAGKEVHLVVETLRGHDLGRIISKGSAAPNTSVPEAVMGMTRERLVRAPAAGTFMPEADIGDLVEKGACLGRVDKVPVYAGTAGAVRGLIQAGSRVKQGQKIGDVDPRSTPRYCHTISDKARALGGAVLTAILGACHG